LGGKMSDDGCTIVGATGATYLIEVRVQQLLQSLAATPNTWVMEFDLESLQFREEAGHVNRCVLCGLTFELSRERRQAA
jgi:hypothetical protein